MFIVKLNKMFEKHGKLAFIIMLLVIIGPFVFFIGPGSARQGFGGLSRDVSMVTIDGKNYDQVKLMPYIQAIQMPVVQMQMMGYNYGYPDEFIIKEAVDRKLMLDEAERLGLAKVTDQDLKEYVQGIPYLQKEGKFDPAIYEGYKATMMRAMRIDVYRFDDIHREDLVVRRMTERLRMEAEKELTDAALRQQFNDRRSKVELLGKIVSPADFAAAAEAAIAKQFPTPEAKAKAAAARYAQEVEPCKGDIEKQLLAGKVNDEAFTAAVEAKREALTSEFKAKSGGKVGIQEEKAIEEQVRQYTERLYRGVRPYFQEEQKRIVYVSFAALPLSPSMADITAEYEKGKEVEFKGKTLAEAMPVLRERIGLRLGLNEAQRRADEFSHELYGQPKTLAAGETLAMFFRKFVESKQMKAVDSEWFTDSPAKTGGLQDPELQRVAYADASATSPLVNVIKGSKACYMACWLDTKVGRVPACQEIEADLLKALAGEEAEKMARAKADEIAAILKKAEKSVVVMTRELDLKSETVTRDAPGSIGSYLLAEASSPLAVGQVLGPVQDSNGLPGAAVARVEKVVPPTDEEFAKEKAAFRDRQLDAAAYKKRSEWLQKLRQDHNLEYNRAMMRLR